MSEVRPISKRELLNYRAELKNQIFRQIRVVFHRLCTQSNVTQKDLAKRLGVDEALISRRLRGQNDMRIETFSDLARGLECRIDVRLTPLSDVLVLNKAKMSPFQTPGARPPYSVELNLLVAGEESPLKSVANSS